MSGNYYFADGYSGELGNGNPNRQNAFICIFNPSKNASNLKFTFYYEDSDPTFYECEVGPEIEFTLNSNDCESIIKNKKFGAKIESTELLVIQITTGYYGEEDKKDWYTRAMHSVLCTDTLSTVNYYADGLVLDIENFRLKEPEWVFILNPNKQSAKVKLNAYYSNGEKLQYDFSIPPERLLSAFKNEFVIKNNTFGAKYTSDIPVAVQQTRLILEEDEKTYRSCYSIMAKNGPL